MQGDAIRRGETRAKNTAVRVEGGDLTKQELLLHTDYGFNFSHRRYLGLLVLRTSKEA